MTTTDKLTIGMVTYDDFDGVYFTVQSIRMHHPEVADHIEFVIVDNHPSSADGAAVADFTKWLRTTQYVPYTERTGTAVRDVVFQRARTDYVLCMDCHVLFVPGALERLIHLFREGRDEGNLLQGPLLYDDLRTLSTHFEPVWRDRMWGIWATDERGRNPDGEPFEIPMQGLGVFACRRDAWLGFSPHFRGFGGEEGYIHEKYRQHGRRTLCLPFLRWMHRFARPDGVPYPASIDDRIRNYLIGHLELGLDCQPVLDHFAEYDGLARCHAEARAVLSL